MGLIPAHAGKTSVFTLYLPWWRAHPRSRGENVTEALDLTGERGSSPLTRGKPCARIAIASMSGLIPAHAGKTYMQSERSTSKGAHPRSRGENRTRGIEVPGFQGSSPLTRGKLGDLEDVHARVRLIPAHAGKTISSPTTGRAIRGSSPLTRGKRCR